MPLSLARCHSIEDLRLLAKRRLPRAVFDYMDGAAEDEVTMRRNTSDFDHHELLPRFLVDVADVKLSTRVLATDIDFPVICAPTGMSRLFHHRGELAVAGAAAASGTIYTLSSMATTSIEDIAGATRGPKWFQVYVWRDRQLLREFIRRCRDAGYTALCLTVDFATAGQRERDLRNGFTVPPQLRVGNIINTLTKLRWLWHFMTTPRMSLANVREHAGADKNLFSVIDYTASQFDPSVTWDDVAWMIDEWQGEFAIKGILTAEDARRAVAAGASAVIVSNHGGRQLDHAPSPISVLSEIVDAVGDELEVILDGGIRRGTDVIKALCLGARAVMVGRAYLYGLGACGEAGVLHSLRLLREEIRRNLMLLGCKSVAELNRSYIRERNRD